MNRNLEGLYNNIFKSFKDCLEQLKNPQISQSVRRATEAKANQLGGRIFYSINEVGVESKEDVEALNEIVEVLVDNSELCKVSYYEKNNFILSLNRVGENDYINDVRNIINNLYLKDEEYLSIAFSNADLVKDALHQEFITGKSNALLDYIFGEYYSIRKLIETQDKQNLDYGKEFYKEIVKDKNISKKYKQLIKKVYQDYKIDEKYHGLNKSAIAASSASLAVAAPFIVAAIPCKLATELIKGVGSLTYKLSELMSQPFYFVSDKIFESDNKNIGTVGLAIAAGVPGLAIQGVGKVAEGIIKSVGYIGDGLIKLATIPSSLISCGILKAGKVLPKDRIKKYNKDIKRNIASVLRTGEKVDLSKIQLGESIVDDNKLIINGKYGNEEFKYSYKIDENVAANIIRYKNDQDVSLKKYLKGIKNIKTNYEIKQQNNSKKSFVLRAEVKEKNIIANVTSQKPIETYQSVVIDVTDEKDV